MLISYAQYFSICLKYLIKKLVSIHTMEYYVVTKNDFQLYTYYCAEMSKLILKTWKDKPQIQTLNY